MADTQLQYLEKIGNQRNPVQETEYQNLLRQQGGQTTSGFGAVSPQVPDVTSLARQMIQLQQEAAQPAISSLQAGIPETSARFATEKTRLVGEKEPLKQRYQSLLDEITRREKVDVSAQERVTSREFGRRGIPLSSGLFDVSLQEAVSPLRQFYTGQTKETGLAQEEGLRGIESLISGLTGQETEQQRAISNAIAQLQAGGSAQGIQSALSLYQQQQQAQQQAAQFAQQQALAQRELGIKEKSLKPSLITLGEGSSLYDPATGKIISTAPKTYKPETSTTGTDLRALQEILGGGQKKQPTAPPSYFKPLSTSYQRPSYFA